MFSHNGYAHGRPFHHAILTSLSLAFLTSLILLILSLYYYEYVIATPTFISSTNDGAKLFLYLLTAPLLTLFQTTTQLLLSNHSLYLTPRSTVLLGFLLFAGWAATASLWLDCEILHLPNPDLPSTTNLPNSNARPQLPSWCPQSPISLPGVMLDTPLAITRDALAWAVTALYGVYLVAGGIAWWKEGVERGDGDGDDCETGTEMREMR